MVERGLLVPVARAATLRVCNALPLRANYRRRLYGRSGLSACVDQEFVTRGFEEHVITFLSIKTTTTNALFCDDNRTVRFCLSTGGVGLVGRWRRGDGL